MKSLSRVRLFATPWTVAYQASLSMGFVQERVLEWVDISFSRGSSRPRDRPLHCKQTLYPLSHQGSPSVGVSLVSLWQFLLVFLFLEMSTFCLYFGIILSLGIEF